MSTDATDIAALRALIAAQAAEIAAQQAEIDKIAATRASQDAELAQAHAGIIEQRFEIEVLRAKLAKLLRMTFGRSPGEHGSKLRDRIEQLELTLADLDELLGEISEPEDPAALAAEEAALAEVRKPARRPLPEALPRDVFQHAPPCDKTGACPGCGGALRPLGEDVTEILDYVPGSFRVVWHVRPKVSCRVCETIAQAPAPSLPRPLTACGASVRFAA